MTLNDLRRTFATWLKLAGVADSLIAQCMGHRDTRMVERTYARLSTPDLAARLARDLGCPAGAPDSLDPGIIGRPNGLGPTAKSPKSMPRGGIEPPTRGFSGRGRLWRSPRKDRLSAAAAGRVAPAVPLRPA